ncbi:MAG: DUF1461 domain-containing protein [Coriobacteriaceae bacterium]|jgi:hypothetical protein|nr:DUF1461 domain-containing protein [Coriobacteriaceae bacterium]
MSAFLRAAIAAISTLCLAFLLLGSGLLLCTAPFTTDFLAQRFSRFEGSPYSQEELVAAANATRDYTVGSHSRESVQAYTEAAASDDSGEATGDKDGSGSTALRPPGDGRPVLTDDALSHLDDVFEVVSAARVALAVAAALALAGCAALGLGRHKGKASQKNPDTAPDQPSPSTMKQGKGSLWSGRALVARMLQGSAGLVAVLFAGIALWAAFDFNGFFSCFHSLFFAAGTWTFSADSLLIRMYPTEFWIGMGVVWLACVLLACIICFSIGCVLRTLDRQRKQK